MNRGQRIAAWIFAALLFLIALANGSNSDGNGWIALASLLAGMGLSLWALRSPKT